jgi:hypothetical protein
MRRSLLKKQLIKAWHTTIDTQYRSQLINSERGLQVYFCSELMRLFQKQKLKRRVFIEPAVASHPDNKRRYPDIVICNSQRIIGVVELKYLPRGKAKFAKDIETLKFVAKHHADLIIRNDRFRGVATGNHQYSLAPDAVLCWAGVYGGDRVDLKLHVSDLMRPSFLQLDAITQSEQHPSVFPKLKK